MQKQMNERDYHEWLKEHYPLGTRLHVTITGVREDGDEDVDVVGEVTGHPFEWEEGGGPESGPQMYLTDFGLHVSAEGVTITVVPDLPEDDEDDGYPDYPDMYTTTIERSEENLGWRKGRDSVIESRRQEQEREHDEMLTRATGLEICPKCGRRSLVVRTFYAAQYGDPPGTQNSTAYHCDSTRCGYSDVAV